MLSELNCVYKFSLSLTFQKVRPSHYFIISFRRLPGSLFVSKKILKKINLVKSDVFLHYPVFVTSFLTKFKLHNYLSTIKDFMSIEYLKFDNLIFIKNIQLVQLFHNIVILKSLNNFLKLYFLFLKLKMLKS